MTLRFRIPVALAVAMIPLACWAAIPEPASVVVPVADVWSRPLAAGQKPADDSRETQVLFGERVLIHESSGSWVRIEAVEQPEFTHHNKWEGYPGWVTRQSMGPRFVMSMDNSPLPKDPVQFAERMIGTRYLWGGLTREYGLDCSGLVHLAYRRRGMQIPRDAHEQWMKARPVKRAELKPADLIFSAKAGNPKKITHVALYAGDGMILEAPQVGLAVRKIAFKDKYGKALDAVESGDRVGERVLYFGSFLH